MCMWLYALLNFVAAGHPCCSASHAGVQVRAWEGSRVGAHPLPESSRSCRVQGAEFFTALFGSERFEHLVGELMIAAAARVGGELGPSQLRKLQVPGVRV